jgi:hypothetical protein
MDMLLGAQNQERTITIKTKPNQEKTPPEQPLSAQSAQLPPEVIAMMQQGLGAMGGGGGGMGGMPDLASLLGEMPPPTYDPMAGQIPMDITTDPMVNPYGG